MAISRARDAVSARQIHDRIPPALPGTRHIPLRSYIGEPTPFWRYLNVPYDYDDKVVEHVTYVGASCIYSNGEIWAVMGQKRLFLEPAYPHIDFERGDPSIEDWPIMSPKELKSALKKKRPLKECQAEMKRRFRLAGYEVEEVDEEPGCGCLSRGLAKCLKELRRS
ncbi:hypothetical protein CC79DRAFT_1402241 [Sarocladium strictum]